MATRDAHAAHFLALAEAAGWRADGPDARRWLSRLVPEWPNLRAAAGWGLDRGDPALVIRLVQALSSYFMGVPLGALGDQREARRWLDAALAVDEGVDVTLRLDALYQASVFAAVEGDLDRAEALAEQGLARAQADADRLREGRALHALALAATFRDDLARAEPLHTRALELLLGAGDTALAGHVLGYLADAALWNGEVDRAAALAEDARKVLAEAGSHIYPIRLLGTLGAIALARGDRAEAARLYRENLSQTAPVGDLRGIGDRRYVADALAGFAGVALAGGEAETAARLLGAATAMIEAVGFRFVVHQVQYERVLAATRASLPGRAFAAAWEDGRRLRPDEVEAEVERVLAGAGATATATDPRETAGLTPREVEVLRLLVAGKSNPQIGEALFISPRTAQTHVTAILAKLGVASRTEAAAVAVRDGLV